MNGTGQTFQSGDTISNAANLNVTVTAAAAAPVAATLSSITNGNFSMLAADTINAALFSNVTNLGSAGGGNILTVTSGDLATTYRVVNETTGGGANNAIVGGVSVGLRAGQLSGTADVAKFSVNNAGVATGTTLTGLTTNFARVESSTTGVETISIATAGSNQIQVFGSTTAATDAKTLIITGNGTNNINAGSITQVSLIDASTSTGTNTIAMGTNLQSAQTIKGGTGADTVSTSLAGTAAGLTFTGIETLSLAGSAATTLSFSAQPGITTVRMEHSAASTGTTDTLINADFTNLTFRGAGTTATSATTQSFNALTSTASFTGTSDALAIGFNNRGTALTTGTGYETGLLTLSGVETATITVADMSLTGTTAIAGITGDRMTALTATSAGNVTLGTITAVGALGTGSLVSINLSGVLGSSASTLAIADNTTTAATTITASKEGINITGFGANQTTDTVIVNGDAGNDTVTGTSFTGAFIIDGKGGADTLIGGTNADTITGGEGTDVITGLASNDAIILTETVAVTDKVVFSGGATTLANQLAANGFDTITGFTSVDTINVAALGDGTTGAAATAITSAAAQGALTDDRAQVISTTGAAANLTTGGTAVVTDWTNLTQVAAYLTERFTAAANCEAVFIINNTTTGANTSYVYSFIETGAANTITAAELILVGQISNGGSALTNTNVVFS